MERFTLRLTKELKEYLEMKSTGRGISLNSMILTILNDYKEKEEQTIRNAIHNIK